MMSDRPTCKEGTIASTDIQEHSNLMTCTTADSLKTENDKKEALYIKIIQTSLVYLTLFGVGFSVAIVGPCLLDFQLLLGTSLQRTTLIFTARSAGYFIGCLLWGVSLDKFDNHFILCLCLFGASLTGMALAWCSAFALLICVIAGWGFCVGGLETGGNVVCVNIWGRDSGPWLQGLHFCFAVGATVAPLIAGPFMTPLNDAETVKNMSTYYGPEIVKNMSTYYGPTVLYDSVDLHNDSVGIHTVNSSVASTRVFTGKGTLWVPYTVISLLYFALTLPFLWLFLRGQRHFVLPKDHHRIDEAVRSRDNESKTFKITLLILLFLFSFGFIGHEITFGGFIYTFAVKSHFALTVEMASYLNSAFWGSFAISRGMGILCAMYLAPRTMLIIDLIGMCTASTLLAILGDTSIGVVWGASILLGISLATVFPSAISWAKMYITLTGKAMSTFTMAAATSELVLPYVLGLLFESHDVMMLMYMTLALSLATAVFYTIMQIIASCHGEKFQQKQQNSDEVHATCDIELANQTAQFV